MIVTREQLEITISKVRAEAAGEREGIYGPDSISWKINREIAVFLGGGRAALLQLAHPAVANAIAQHSNTRTDPMGRFQRTFDRVFAMVFGTLDDAIDSARRVHHVHERILGTIKVSAGSFVAGSAYQANDPLALFWVHATLVDSALRAYELMIGPLDPWEKETYYSESRRFAGLFGIPEASMPADYAAFQRYNERMWGELRVTPSGRELAHFLLSSAAIRPAPLARWYRLTTSWLLPKPLRDQFGLGLPSERQRRLSLAAASRTYRALPSRMRWTPAYLDARRRLAGKTGRDRVGMLVEKALISGTLGRRGR